MKDLKGACTPSLVFTEKERKREQRKKTDLRKEVIGERRGTGQERREGERGKC